EWWGASRIFATASVAFFRATGNLDARDRAAGRSCVVDGSVDATTLRGGGDRLPVGCRFDRRRAGAAAFRQCRRQARPSASCGARLGRPASRDAAQARHPVDPLGGIYHRQSWRLSVLPVLRAVSGIKVEQAVLIVE